MTYRNTGCPADFLLSRTLCSLKGSVSEVALDLGDQLTLDKLLQGLGNHSGLVSKYDMLYWELCHISQRPLETVVQFSTQVCIKISVIRSVYPGSIPDAQVDEVK